jgi:hypothetical protein
VRLAGAHDNDVERDGQHKVEHDCDERRGPLLVESID